MPLIAGTPGTGHHKVTLAWNSSRSGGAGDPAGYCLYRSTTPHATRKDPRCTKCERINQAPITQLSCVDDLVEDGTTYYYVVKSITATDNISLPSNEILALIPRANQTPANATVSSAPLCRAPANGR